MTEANDRIEQALRALCSRAARVVENWESGDLSHAVRELDRARREARQVLEDAGLIDGPKGGSSC